jgi:hypothetical protein
MRYYDALGTIAVLLHPHAFRGQTGGVRLSPPVRRHPKRPRHSAMNAVEDHVSRRPVAADTADALHDRGRSERANLMSAISTIYDELRV